MVLEALLCECRSGCTHDLLYSDNLVLIAASMEELSEKFKKWRDQGTSDKFEEDKNNGDCRWPCSVCEKGVGSNLGA